MAAPTATEADIKLSRELQNLARALSKVLDEIAGTHVLFSLQVWGEGKAGGFSSYVSNAERADIIKAMREWLSYAEADVPDTPLHERQ